MIASWDLPSLQIRKIGKKTRKQWELSPEHKEPECNDLLTFHINCV